MADKKSDGGKNFLAFLTGGIKEYGNVMAERTKLQSQMMSNRLTANQNWLYKLQQQQAERKMQNQRVKDAYQGGAEQAGYGYGYGPSGERKLTSPAQEKQTFTKGKVATVIGNLQNKGMRDPYNNIIPFGDRERATEYVRSQLGPNWKEIAPEAAKIMDKVYGVGGGAEERFNELMKAMSEEEAYAQLIEEGF